MPYDQSEFTIGQRPEDQRILELAARLRRRGKDPEKVLTFALETLDKAEKMVEIGKSARGYFKKSWEAFEREFKKDRK